MNDNSNSKKNKHLTPSDRKDIEECLCKRMTFKAIGKLIGKDPTTVSYEVKHHRQAHKNSFVTEEAPCPSLFKAPFVCNGCPKKHSSSCHFMRYYYRANNAQAEYKALLTDAREGIPLNKEKFYETDRSSTGGLENGQHIYHNMTNSLEIICSKSTVSMLIIMDV